MPEVTGILKDNGYPGMKVLEFAFDGNRRNPHLPYNYTRDLVVYGGTHDNETLYGYLRNILMMSLSMHGNISMQTRRKRWSGQASVQLMQA